MSLQHLLFDVTDADTRAASSNVGAYLRSADGTLLTHTDVGGKKALDVRVAEGINVEVDLAAADDSVAAWLKDGSGNALSSTGGALHIADGGGSITVDGAVTVSATDLDIRDLTAASDSVASWLKDGSGNAIGSTGGALDVNIASGSVTVTDAALANAAISANKTTVGTSLISSVSSILSNRKYLFVYNNGNKPMYLGTTGNTAADGFPMFPGMGYEFRAGASIDMKVISDGTSQDLRHLQLS